MIVNRAIHPDVARNLALAILTSSNAPALLLDEELIVIAASTSFYRAFALEPQNVIARPLLRLGAGEWDVPQLRSLLAATLSGHARIEAYEMDLKGDAAERRLVLNAQKLDYGDAERVRLLLTISDVTEARISEKLKDDLLREKAILLQEIQHRVANSLQIIASVLMQSAKRVQSDETRGHLRDAHNRVMSIATVQQQLAASRIGDVELRGYFTQLCQSLGASMIHDHDQLSLAVTADNSSVKADISVSLGLIVTELVINALKHAFPEERSGMILVDYRSHGEDWKLSVSDDGVGTPEKMADAKPGLGTSIVEALANQLDATVETEGGHPGTIVSVAHTGAKDAVSTAPASPKKAA
jgi:two-component sensor histidine kinase